MINPAALTIRAKKLGVLVRDARLASGKSIAECAQVLGVPEETFELYEEGEKSPSLPEVEALAYFLDVPLGQFWSSKALSLEAGRRGAPDFERLIALRHRVIGALIRQARQDSGMTLEDVAEKAWSSSKLLEAYEMGEMPIPLPDLEVLSYILDEPLRTFHDRHGPVGAWMNEQNMVQSFLALPPELQAFVSKPVNRPYLELAQRLSEMDVSKLRSVAEGLLDITL